MGNGKRPNFESKSGDLESSDFESDVLSQLGADDSDDPSERDNDDDPDQSGEREYEEADEPDDSQDEGDEREAESESEEDEGEAEGQASHERRDAPDRKPAKLQADKRGNLVDPRTGKIVAPAGAARRFYEDLQREKVRSGRFYQDIQRRDGVMRQAAEAMKQLHGKVTELEKGNALSQQLGLDQNETVEALNFMSKFKNNATALDALKFILTKAVQRGIDIKPLGAGAGAFDPTVIAQSVEQQIQNALKPIQDRQQGEAEQEKIRREVQQEIQGFVTNNPEARKFLPVLGRIVSHPEYQGISLDHAWVMLQNYLLRKQAERGQSFNERRTERRGRPMGASHPGASRSGRESRQIDDSPVSVDTDFKDIVKGVMNDYGTNF